MAGSIVEDEKDSLGLWKRTVNVYGKNCNTRSYSIWKDMIRRCKGLSKNHPTYKNCVVSDNFKDFQFFSDWCQNQIGYGLQGYSLDKDILGFSEKKYCESICVFIPQSLNSFLCGANANRGEYPQGVSFCKFTNKFSSNMSFCGKKEFLGRFEIVEDAAKAYSDAKTAGARKWYNKLKDGEFIVDGRVIERMLTWEFKS